MNKNNLAQPVLMLWQMFLLAGVSLTLSLFSVLTLYLQVVPPYTLVTVEPPTVKLQQLTIALLQQGDLYHQVSPELKPFVLADLFRIAHQRAQLLEQIVKTDPAAVLKVSLPLALQQRLPGELTTRYALEESGQVLGDMFPPVMRAQLPFSLVPELEEEIIVEGELEVLHADYFDHGLALEEYAVRDSAGRRLVLNFAAQHPQLMSGSRVKIRGVRVGNQMAVARGQGQDFEVTFAAQPGHTVKKVAVILFNFTDNSSQPQSADAVRQLVFTGSPSVNGYFREASFGNLSLEGKLRLDGDVFGWFPLNYPQSPCSYSTWAQAAQVAAAAQGFSASGYNHIVYAFPRSSACGWGGLGTVGGNPGTVWINGNFTITTIGHELGHNLGAHHAAALNCTNPATGTRTTLSDSCTMAEYGDPFDIMAVSTRHASNFHKGRLNWLPVGNTQTITQSGTYTLYPQEFTLTTPQVLRLPRDYDSKGNPTTYYYLEYRQPFGAFDNFSTANPVVKGVSIRLAPAYTVLQQTKLLDMVPATTTFSDSALPLGATFTDSAKNISFTVLSADTTSAQVRLDLGDAPACVPASPQLAVSPLAQWGVSGQILIYELTVTSADSSACTAEVYNLNVQLPAGFTQTATPQSVTLAPGASQTIALSVTSSSSAADGFYNITETVTRATGQSSSLTLNYNISNPPAEEPAEGAGDVGAGSDGGTTTPPPASASLDLAVPTTIYYIKNKSNLTATATVKDSAGNPLPNIAVTLTIYRPDGTVAATKIVSTNRRTGQAALSYKLKPQDKPGSWPALATTAVSGNILQASGAFTVQ